MELYVVRHGRTKWNAEGRLQGTTDIALDEEGRRVAIELGERMDRHGIVFDAIYVSPLIRAYETACLIRGRHNIPIIRDERLRELGFGICEGASYEEWLDSASPYRCFFEEPERYLPPEEGESLESVCQRTKEFVREVLESKPSEGRYMVVAHGALNKGMMCYLEGNTIDRFWGEGLQKNCEADIFVYDGRSWNRRKE